MALLHTRKGNRKRMEIPELKRAFDALRDGINKILKEGDNNPAQIRKMQKLFKSIFHRPISAESAEAYIQIRRGTVIKLSKRRTRKQKGGMAALAGAPLDFMTRPGIDGTHVSVPAYQTQGLGFYNKINMEGITQECGTKDITPFVPVTIGSNEVQKGGGSPPGIWDDMGTALQGRHLGASPDPSYSKLIL